MDMNKEQPSAFGVAIIGKSLGEMFSAVLEKARDQIEDPQVIEEAFRDNLGVLVKLACPEIEVTGMQTGDRPLDWDEFEHQVQGLLTKWGTYNSAFPGFDGRCIGVCAAEIERLECVQLRKEQQNGTGTN